jgi:hypothetical protein
MENILLKCYVNCNMVWPHGKYLAVSTHHGTYAVL